MKITVPLLLLRFFLAWTFLWAFFDKLFGLGHATASEKAWILGYSPTKGFLAFGIEGKMFQDVFQPLAGNPVVDILFMFGLLGIGLAFLFGVCTKIAGYATSVLTLLMFLAVFPPDNNPLTDEHILYAISGLILASSTSGDTLGLGKWWKKKSLVKRHQILI